MRTEQKMPWTPYPPLAAVVFMALVVVSLWRESSEVESPALPGPAAVAKSAPAAVKASPVKVPETVAAFTAFAQADLPAGWPETRAQTARGLRLLADAMATRGDSTLWRDRAVRLVDLAAAVEQAPDALQAADAAHGALVQAADWIEDLGPAPIAAGPGNPLVAAAKAVDADHPLREQSKELDRFFDAAARALAASRA